MIEPAGCALERIRLLLFSADLPVQRLQNDIDDIGRFIAPDGHSSRLRPVGPGLRSSPSLKTIVLWLHAEALTIVANQRRPS